MSSPRCVLGWASVPKQVRLGTVGLLRVGDAHAVPADAAGGGQALCGTHVDEVDSERPFPPHGDPEAAEPCQICLQLTAD
jgi:hypothetical protein